SEHDRVVRLALSSARPTRSNPSPYNRARKHVLSLIGGHASLRIAVVRAETDQWSMPCHRYGSERERARLVPMVRVGYGREVPVISLPSVHGHRRHLAVALEP